MKINRMECLTIVAAIVFILCLTLAGRTDYPDKIEYLTYVLMGWNLLLTTGIITCLVTIERKINALTEVCQNGD